MHGKAPKCGRRSRRAGRWGWCAVSRVRNRWGRYLPACMAHLSVQERAAYGIVAGGAPRPRAELVDVAKIRAGDRD